MTGACISCMKISLPIELSLEIGPEKCPMANVFGEKYWLLNQNYRNKLLLA